MLEQRYHVTTQNWFHPDMSTVNKNIAVEAKLISPPMYKSQINTCWVILNIQLLVHWPEKSAWNCM